MPIKSVCILLLVNDRLRRAALLGLLRGAGYADVLAASTPGEAVQLLCTRQPDLVVLECRPEDVAVLTAGVRRLLGPGRRLLVCSPAPRRAAAVAPADSELAMPYPAPVFLAAIAALIVGTPATAEGVSAAVAADPGRR